MTAAATTRSLAALGTLFALAACGGGGDTGTPAPPPPSDSSSATLSVTLAGGASPGVDHLWVTVEGVALNADKTKPYSPTDSSWVVLELQAPVTVDLAAPALSQGQSVSLLKQTVSALGTYQQLRLLIASSDPGTTLRQSAKDAGITWNDQVQYTDAGGSHAVPLELPDIVGGIRMLTPFTLSGDTTTPVSIEWNAHASLVRRPSAGGPDRFTLRDELELYNQQLLTALGGGSLQIDGSLFDAISGHVDTSAFCGGVDHAGCIHDVVASATSLSADGRFHVESRSVNVGADGSFLLYPLPSESVYDVVIHGGNMQTIVVRNIFVDPTGLLHPAPSAISTAAAPLVPVLDTSGRDVAVSNALAPAASRVVFGFTLPGNGNLPYVLDFGAADPLTGSLPAAVPLPGGPVHDGAFASNAIPDGTPPAFTTVTPAEGLGGFTVWTEGTLADTASPVVLLAPAATSIVAPAPQRVAGFSDGQITVTLSGTPTNGADHAEVIVSDAGGTVAVADASAVIAHGGSVALTVPAGKADAAPAAAVYGVALRTWQAGAAETTSARWVRASAPTSLEAASSASVSLDFP